MKINSKIFKEYDIRGQYPNELNEQAAYALGLAFAKLTKAKKIVVGRDRRPQSEKVLWPLLFGLSQGGMQIYDLGVCSSPELFFAVGDKKFESGVMITASHSPAGQTGFKFCDSRGRVYGLKTGLKRLEKLAQKEIGKIRNLTLMPTRVEKSIWSAVAKDYKKFAFSFVNPRDLDGFRVIMDASSGSGYRLPDFLFKKAPFELVKINFRPGDKYPDHGLNPLLPENQRVVSKEIKKRGADLGVILDGDGDRAVFLDETGRFIEPYHINCLLSQIFLEIRPGMAILFDARLKLAITETIEKNGGRPISHRSGYANLISFMNEKKLLFGCENSGHFLLSFLLKKRSYYVYGDTLIVLLLIMKHLRDNKLKLSEAVAPFSQSYSVSGEINFKIKDFSKLAKKIVREFAGHQQEKTDGLSIWDRDRTWFFNIRPSHTEPLIRLNIEARNKQLMARMKNKLTKIIKKN